MRRRHVAAYRGQFDRCRLDLGPDIQPGKTIPQRLSTFRETKDTYLAQLYFAFGRYLLISSSQPGSQPPSAWPNGDVRGLRARGGYTVDISWRDGRLVSRTIFGGDADGYVIVEPKDAAQARR